MGAPLQFAITQRSNEPLIAPIIFPWRRDQWPLPAGSTLRSDVRVAAGDVDRALVFSSADGSIQIAWDDVNAQLVATLSARLEAVATLAAPAPYVGDVTLTRPQGGGLDDRVDVIGVYTLTITQGVTRD